MPAKRVNPKLIKLHRPYSIDDAARALGVHKHTMHAWIKQGLPVLASQRPALVMGDELRAFLEARRKRARRPCGPGTIYCLKCREPRRPALGMVDYTPHSATGGNLKAICEVCGKPMHQRIAFDAIARKMPGMDVQIREAKPRLTGSPPSPLNCDNQQDVKHHV